MLIDLSVNISEQRSDPDSPRITYLSHREGARNLISGAQRILFEKNPLQGSILFLARHAYRLLRAAGLASLLKIRPPFVSVHDFPQGMGLANEEIELDTHTGTHLDAPWHFGPAAGESRARTINEVPLDWCYGDGVVLDFRHKGAGEAITRDDIAAACEKIGYAVKPHDIVLIMTGADRHWDTEKYFTDHPGMSAAATAYLLEQGVKIIGIDAWGFDRPALRMLGEFLKTRDSDRIFPAHFVGREREYCHIEKLANLDKIPRPYGFKVACFPVKITGASAGWCRAVAIV